MLSMMTERSHQQPVELHIPGSVAPTVAQALVSEADTLIALIVRGGYEQPIREPLLARASCLLQMAGEIYAVLQ